MFIYEINTLSVFQHVIYASFIDTFTLRTREQLGILSQMPLSIY